jgi:hypothetical protein
MSSGVTFQPSVFASCPAASGTTRSPYPLDVSKLGRIRQTRGAVTRGRPSPPRRYGSRSSEAHRRPPWRQALGRPLSAHIDIARRRARFRSSRRPMKLARPRVGPGRGRRETGRPLGAMWGKQQRPHGEPRGRRWPGKHRAPDGASVSWLVAKTFHARDFIVTIVGCCWLSRGPREADLRVETWRPSRRPSTNQTNAGVINSEWQSQRRPRRARPR